MDNNDLSFSQILDNMPDEIFWPVMDELEKELNDLVNGCLMDGSVAQMTTDDDR